MEPVARLVYVLLWRALSHKVIGYLSVREARTLLHQRQDSIWETPHAHPLSAQLSR